MQFYNAIELYKRNKFTLVVGHKTGDFDDSFKTASVTDGVPTYKLEERTDKAEINVIHGFYESPPNVTFSNDFNTSVNGMNRFMADASTLKGKWDAGVNAMKGWLSGIRNRDAGEQRLMDAIDTAPTARFAPPMTLHWQNNTPVSFTMKFIFIDPLGKAIPLDRQIAVLLSTVGSQEITGGVTGIMKGPIGYNSIVLGAGAVEAILNPKKYVIKDKDAEKQIKAISKALHSLTLWQGDTKILDLRNVLIIKSVNLKTSEQLFTAPQGGKNIPYYKWITADIEFSTVCPIPAPLSNCETTSLNFFGISENAWRMPTKEIPEKKAEKKQNYSSGSANTGVGLEIYNNANAMAGRMNQTKNPSDPYDNFINLGQGANSNMYSGFSAHTQWAGLPGSNNR